MLLLTCRCGMVIWNTVILRQRLLPFRLFPRRVKLGRCQEWPRDRHILHNGMPGIPLDRHLEGMMYKSEMLSELKKDRKGKSIKRMDGNGSCQRKKSVKLGSGPEMGNLNLL